MFRLQRSHIAVIQDKIRVPLTGTRSYLVTVAPRMIWVKLAFSNGATVVDSPVRWDHEPVETHDEFLESLPEAQ